MGKNVCGGCGLIFASLGSFDTHRTGNYQKIAYGINGKPTGEIEPSTRRCLTIPEIQALGIVQNDKGWWCEKLTEEARAYFERMKTKREAAGVV